MRPLGEILDEETWYVNRFNEVFADFKMYFGQVGDDGIEIEAHIIYAYLDPTLMPEGVISELAKLLYTDGTNYFLGEMQYKKGPYEKEAQTLFEGEELTPEELEAQIKEGLWESLMNLESGSSVNEELKLIFDLK